MSRGDPGTLVYAAGCRHDELPVASFRPRPTVLGTRVRESVVLLDRTTERYLTLNEVAGAIWERLAAGATPAVIVEQLCAEFDAPREQVAADVAAQVEAFLEDGLIESATSPGREALPSRLGGALPSEAANACAHVARSATPAGIRLPSHLQCALQIAQVKVRLTVQGYDRTLRWVRRQVEATPANAHADVEMVRAAEYRVAMAAAFFPGRALCLEQSLTLYLLMRRRGVAVRYCQGVQPHPFEAHAWVEYRGRVVNDVDEHVKLFTPLPDQLP